MSAAITCDVILSGIRTRSDGSISLTLATPELDGEGIAAFAGLRNRNLKLLLQPTEEAPAELKEIKGEFDRKTDSQRLRGLLYVQWKQTKTDQDFDSYYKSAMYAFCESVRNKLEPDV